MSDFAERAPAAPILRVSALEKTYARGPRVLGGVDLAVAPAERVALIGSNGAGKSTLLRAAVALTPFDAGAVEVLGERFEGGRRDPSAERRVRRRIGFVFQHHGLVKRLSAFGNVLHGLLGLPGGWRAVAHGLAPAAWRERAMAALDDVGLADKATARVDALSGGQRQRVAVARALIRRPALLIADEPAASLDPVAGREVMAVFSELARRHGAAFLYTTHDMEHATGFSDRVVALKGGRVAFDRPSAAVDARALEEVFDGRAQPDVRAVA